MSISRYLVFGMISLSLLLGNKAWAQQHDVQESISQANEYYRVGKLNEALEVMEGLEGLNSTELRETRVLRIKVLLAQDRIPLAMEEARRLLTVQPGFEPDYEDPNVFKDLIRDVRVTVGEETVASVSKIAENPYETPATLYVITEEEIERRGYTDLIELLKDQPGFDIVNLFSATYANIYQRGYRSLNTERTLLLIDGVEENDLYFNIPYISRQYPMSNIARVEIIYGPASTMYGPNAFVGVINVVTKGTHTSASRQRVEAHAGYGSYNSRYADATYAGVSPSGRLRWSMTGRTFWSDEADMSSDSAFDYNTDYIDQSSRYATVLETIIPDGVDEASYLTDSLGLPASHPYFEVVTRDGQRVVAPTAAGIAQARAYDRALFNEDVNGNTPTAFSNGTQDYYLRGQFQIDRLRITAQHWSRNEGINPLYTDMVIAPAANGSKWVPKNFTLNLEYDQPLNPEGTWTFTTQSNYRYHHLDPSSSLVFATNYWRGSLGMADLVNEEQSYWVDRHYFEEARQLRSEQRFVYAPGGNLSWVSGLELRNTQLQGDYLIVYENLGTARDSVASDCRDYPNPQVCGEFDETLTEGGNQYTMWDVGTYTQVQYQFPQMPVKLVAGTRVDYNRIRASEGFGLKVNPRLALVATPNARWVFKGFYASGIQNPSQWSKYSTGSTRVPNPDITTESIRNLEGSARYQWQQGAVDVSTYYSQVTGVVGTRRISSISKATINDNVGNWAILGTQITAQHSISEHLSLWGNYSFTLPRQTALDTLAEDYQANESTVYVADIARHQIKAGVNVSLFKDQLVANVRGQWVSRRRTGMGTTNPSNPLDGIPGYGVAYLTLTGKLDAVVPGLSAQLIANNLLNATYYHPGPRNGDGYTNPSYIPQRGLNVHLRIMYHL